jgi:hypothetical protein
VVFGVEPHQLPNLLTVGVLPCPLAGLHSNLFLYPGGLK